MATHDEEPRSTPRRKRRTPERRARAAPPSRSFLVWRSSRCAARPCLARLPRPLSPRGTNPVARRRGGIRGRARSRERGSPRRDSAGRIAGARPRARSPTCAKSTAKAAATSDFSARPRTRPDTTDFRRPAATAAARGTRQGQDRDKLAFSRPLERVCRQTYQEKNHVVRERPSGGARRRPVRRRILNPARRSRPAALN